MPGYAHAGGGSGQPYRATPDWRGHGAFPQGKLVGPPDHASCGERAGRVACHRSARWRGHALAWWQVLPRPARARIAAPAPTDIALLTGGPAASPNRNYRLGEN